MSVSVTAPYSSAEALRSRLLEAGLLVATRADGLYHRSGAFEDLVTAVERWSAGTRLVTGVPRRFFPPVLPREDFGRTDYLRSFPDLVGSVHVFGGGDETHRVLLARLEVGEDWTTLLEPAEVVLSSSICHSLYGTLPTEIPADGLRHECCGYAFRHEPSLDPTRMQTFRMYEFVLVGTPAQALEHRDRWRDHGHRALSDLGLPVRAEPANDPFFGRAGRMLAANQRRAELKFELVVDLFGDRSTAIASANYHEDHFGAPFGLLTAGGEIAHSACFGYGLERIALALLAVHGLDVDTWPGQVREALSC